MLRICPHHSCSSLQTLLANSSSSLNTLANSNSQHTPLMLLHSSSHTRNTITPTLASGQVFSLFTLTSSSLCLPRTVTTVIIMCQLIPDISQQQLKFMVEHSHSMVQYTVSTQSTNSLAQVISLPRLRTQVLLMYQLCQLPQVAPPQLLPSTISILMVQDRHAGF